MELEMPLVREELVRGREEIVIELEGLLGEECVIGSEEGRRVFECDGLHLYRNDPLVVVMAGDREDVVKVMKYAGDLGIPVVLRGAGTGLTGGALPVRDGILLVMTRLDRILEVDVENMCARVEAGVTNLSISDEVSGYGLFYAPDPSSQLACSIGGNVSENSGGAHCLKYGVTSHNLLGLEVVLMGGEVVHFGGKGMDMEAWDWLGVLTGSEGMLGVVTEVTVRLRASPETARAILIGFDKVKDAALCIERVMAEGMTPACMEFMDGLCIKACEEFSGAGYPLDVEALMVVECDGSKEEVDGEIERLRELAEGFSYKHFRVSESEEERERIWRGRKGAFSAVARLMPDYMTMDGTIARGKLAEALEEIGRLSREYGILVGNVFHAGDGNMHPLILFDGEKEGEEEKAFSLAMETLRVSVEAGGVISGEHGIGVEKRDRMGLMFSEGDMGYQLAYKRAFDPLWLLNPGKVFPLEVVKSFREVYDHGVS